VLSQHTERKERRVLQAVPLSADCCKKPYGLAWREAEKQQAVRSACDTLDELTLLLDC